MCKSGYRGWRIGDAQGVQVPVGGVQVGMESAAVALNPSEREMLTWEIDTYTSYHGKQIQRIRQGSTRIGIPEATLLERLN